MGELIIRTTNGELYHHGIKGQKWGIRRFQNTDGSLKSAGKKRYDREKKKQAHHDKIVNKYIKEGLSKKDAEVAALKREKVEKILKVAGAITLTAAAAYVAYNHYDKVTDRILDTSTELHNISVNSNKGVEDAFYASYQKMDRMKYRGLYGKSKNPNDVYDMSIKINDKIKIASEKSGLNALKKAVKRNGISMEDIKNQTNDIATSIIANPLYANNVKAQALLAMRSAKKGKINDSVYRMINMGLVGDDDQSKRIKDNLYKTLKSSGYNGVIDINDKKLSGYGTKNPLIIFDGKDNLSISDRRKLLSSEVNKDNIKALGLMYTKEFAKLGAAGITTYTAVDKASQLSDERNMVKKYREDHPKSKLSYDEIVKVVKKEQEENPSYYYD